jgi:S1 RNA binding domain protein
MRIEGDLNEGDLVVVEITDVEQNSAYAQIKDHTETTGLIHISEISRSWIDDASDEISEGEKTVAQVVNIEDGTAELSLKRVNETQKRNTIAQRKRRKKAASFLEQVAEELGETPETVYNEVGKPIQEEMELFEAFEIAHAEEQRLLEIISQEAVDAIKHVSSENMDLKQKKLEGKITCKFSSGNGAEQIRDTFSNLPEGVETKYVSAPKYSMTAWGRNTELAKKKMDEAVEKARKRAESHGGKFKFERD